MAHGWVNVTYMSEEDYQAWLAKQKASTTSTNQQQ
jgi:hypothetical protein